MYKKIGIIGGFSTYSTLRYYQLLTENFTRYCKPEFSPEIIIYHLDYRPVLSALLSNNFPFAINLIANKIKQLEQSGVQCIVIPCNSLHIVIDELQETTTVPIISIIDSVGKFLSVNQVGRCLLLGSDLTMTHDFYKCHLYEKYHIDILIPDLIDVRLIDYYIFNYLCMGKYSASLEQQIAKSINQHFSKKLWTHSILACTELSLINTADFTFPLVDSLDLHVQDILRISIGVQ